MSDITESKDNWTVAKKYRSLSLRLVLWFLLLALLPLVIVSWFSYQQASQSLIEVAEDKLQESSLLRVRFIQNWFEYRVVDLSVQAESQNTAHMLAMLIDGLQSSDKSPTEYVNSDDWAKRVDDLQNDLVTFSRRYDYIYDLFLIDVHGNILYSVARESDLGSNLLTGSLSDSRLAGSVKATLETGQTAFSDIERYAPSNETYAGFLTAPLLDEFGGKLGVFAVQLKFDRIFDLLNSTKSDVSTSAHYIVAEDGILRTSINNNWGEVLERRLQTEQYRRIHQEQIINDPEHVVDGLLQFAPEKAVEYTGPNGVPVIGIHQRIRLANINWFLISEIDREEALAAAGWHGKVILLLMILTGLTVIVLAVWVARKITQPIRQLADVSMKVAAGETEQKVKLDSQDEIGQLAAAFNHMLDMRQIHEQALQRSTQEAQQALADLAEQKFALDQHAIVAVTDVQGTITYTNSKFAEISGYSQDELLGQNHRILNSGHHRTEFFRDMYRTVGSGDVWHGEICNKAKTGNLYWVDTTIVPFKGMDGKPQSYVAIRADITQRKQAELAMVEAKEVAEQAARAKSEFLASMSHEIRTPMNGVLGMLGLLLNTELDSVQRHRTLIAQSSAQSLLTLINDILDFSKVDAGKLELELMDFNLRGMLGEFAETFALQVQDKNLELVLDVTGVEHSTVKGDPGRLRQILTNLVGNAIKFTAQGEIVIRVDLQRYDEQRLCMQCSVTDTGIGIPAEKLGQLFDSFSQVDASTTRKYGGTGLGLAICKKLCELMGGEVSVSSEPGKGSCFAFNVLLQTCEQSQLVVPRVDIRALNLLVVDDNTTNREVLRGQLEHWGASVVEAVDGAEALALCDARIRHADTPFFDIVFLDMQMPGMDGAELGEKLQADARFSAMKLVMMTSMGAQGDVQRFARLGFSAYFPKPATTSDLFDALAVVAEGGKALQQAQPLVTHHYLRTLSHDQQEPTAAGGSTNWPENTRVLLVEDNKVNQLVAIGILNDIGLQADVAENGIEALRCLSEAADDKPYNLVLMDCQMPEMDGYEASRQIRAGQAGGRSQDIPVIAMTANAMSGDKEKCLAAGMNDYLSKPIDTDLLHNKLRQWLLDSALPPSVDKPTVVNESGASPEPVDITTELDLAVWDKEDVLKRILGQQELLNSLVDVFLREFPLRLAELTQAIDENKCDEVCRLAHGVKGMLANLSCLQLQHQSVCLETAAKTGDMDKVTQLMPGYQVASEQLIRCFEHYAVQQKEEKKQPPGRDQQLQGLLQDIAAKLQQGDYIDVEVLAPLRQVNDNPAVQELLHQLLGQIGLFDFLAAQQTLKEVEVLAGMKLNLEETEVD